MPLCITLGGTTYRYSRGIAVTNVIFSGCMVRHSTVRIIRISGLRRHLQKKKIVLTKIFMLIRIIKSRKIRWAGHVARIGRGRGGEERV
jgi:hypothetical protein